MSSRTILVSLSFAIFLGVPLATSARAGTPADSTVTAPGDSSASEAKHELKEAKEDAGNAINKEEKKQDDKKDEAKKERQAAKKNAKKSKTKAAKGTVKKVDTKAASGTMPVKPDVMPQHVQVQHILIGFSGSVPGKAISRSKEEAKKLAYEVLERARKGEDFNELVVKYTDDSPPGIYGMSGAGVQPAPGEYARDSMVAAFGNVGFSISPGNIGIADYDPAASPFGWHIIKRLK